MDNIQLLTRVLYYLPTRSADKEQSYLRFISYAQVVDWLRRHRDVSGFSETEVHGFWKESDSTAYFDKVRVITADYALQEALEPHIRSVHDFIASRYASNGCPESSSISFRTRCIGAELC